ncbi:hypothetical protein K3495_g6474 [Podosphaera aphanis]|nr:hypothetical protein K3495_g6474 [Podosphaera aphanis]
MCWESSELLGISEYPGNVYKESLYSAQSLANNFFRVYQEYCAKNLTNKYAALNTQMDKIIHDANAELLNMRNKLSSMQLEQDNLRRKNTELAQQLRDKTRKYHQTQELYDKMKRRSLLDHVQNAASDAVEQTIQDSVATNRYVDTTRTENPSMPPPPLFSDQNSSNSNGASYPGVNIGDGIDRTGTKPWAGYCRQVAPQSNHIQTPSTHRTKFPPENFQPQIGLANLQEGITSNQFQMNSRGPLPNIGRNSHGFAGYGISSGIKTSAPSTGAPVAFMRPTPRTRVAQRKPSGLSTNENFQRSHNISVIPNDNY